MKLYWRLGWRNIWRNKRRSTITIAALAFSVALMVFCYGFMESYAIDPLEDIATPLLLREERRGGRVFAAPNGTLALIGGEHPDGEPAVTVEMLFPSE